MILTRVIRSHQHPYLGSGARIGVAVSIGSLCMLLVSAWWLAADAQQRYATLLSPIVYDRYGIPMSISENSRGHYVLPHHGLPDTFTTHLILKEDRFFYYHVGINPLSTVRAISSYLMTGKAGGSSTITQQLAKIILGNESERTLSNKFVEALYAVSLELYLSKATLLDMYANTAYLGNQVQGFETASYAYFNKSLRDTTHSEQLSLLATLSYPDSRNPWETSNVVLAEALHNRISPQEVFIPPIITDKYRFQRDAWFELQTADIACRDTCATTIDESVTQAIRTIVNRHVQAGTTHGIRSGGVVVIDPTTSELIALIGSPNPRSTTPGNQVNMAILPRPIGSTIKPFIYGVGFMEGLRPYTLVEDREYKYPIATGFSLYPKNYDGLYRGEVTLHEALSNSLNVPTVKVLEYIGLSNFYHFLSEDLRFSPMQPYDSYQYGIALGGLEMDLLTLTHYFTLFPRGGTIAPLRILTSDDTNFDLPPQSMITESTRVLSAEAVALAEVILSDRFAGVNQFGLAGNLNLSQDNYAVKTGTSRDYHDSWVIGYTPDFVVGVWLGNTENEPMDQVSGSSGAGAVWHDVMEYLFTSPYNRHTPLSQPEIVRIPIAQSDEWGLRGDDVSHHQRLLSHDTLILSLHEGDVFALEPTLAIPLQARRLVTWSINGAYVDTTVSTTFTPTDIGRYEIMAYDEISNTREIITISVTIPN